MKKRLYIKIPERFPGEILFLVGFLIGTILPNLIWKNHWKQETMTVFYLLSAFAGKNIPEKKYFLEILRLRGSWFLVCALCGFSIFGVPLAVFTIWGMGIKAGAVLSMAILQFGFVGGAAGMALLFPQGILYLMAGFYLLEKVYGFSMNCWRGKGIFFQGVSRYGLCVLGSGILCFSGILLETYVNPWIVEKVVKLLNFF